MSTLRRLFVVVLLMATGLAPATELDKTLSLEEIRHLLGRTGFGASPDDINRLAGRSRRSAIDSIVSNLATTPSSPPPAWIKKPAPHHWARNQLGKVARREFNEARQREMESLRLWWLHEMIQTPSPQTERLVLFWHGHFATAYTGINDQGISIARQHVMLRELGSGNFRTLLKAVIRDPAMLNYLDNNSSRKQAPNENLARELMELFTLGEGNYSETDIKNAARALTGYSTAFARNMLFQFKPAQHDTGQKTLFGRTGNFNGDDVVDLILEQPAAAEFLAGKFWKMLVTEQAPDATQITAVANRFRASGYEIKTLYKAILESDAFWNINNRSSIVKSPVDITIGTIRSTGVVPQTWQLLPVVTGQLGQQLFEPPNVAGWPGGRAWVSPGRLLNRLNWLNSFQTGCTDDSCEAGMQMNSMAQMSMQPEQQASMSSANTQMSPAADKLIIRMASEEFDGPVRYRVTLLLADMIVWTSGPQELQGGYDTNRFGKRTSRQPLPWQNVSFQLPARAAKFNTIEIEYLNDKHQRGLEKNLHIEQVSYKHKTYDASRGRQFNECKNRKRSRGGTMLCNGKLRLTKPDSKTDNADKKPDNNNLQDHLSASAVYIKGVQNTINQENNRRPATLSFTLADARFAQRRWHSLTVSYRLNKDNQYSMGFSSESCWPDCLDQWPACTTVSKEESATRRLQIPMPPGSSGQCSYAALNESDKKLVNLLWQNLPLLYEAAKSSKKLNKNKAKSSYDSWAGHISALSHNLAGNSDTQPVVELTGKLASKAQLKAVPVLPTPEPAGRSSAETQSDLRELLARESGITLQGLLLPDTALDPDSAGNTLSDILTNLAFQLK